MQQLEGLIDGVHTAVLASPQIEHEGRSSHGRIFYGWYLRSVATKKALWFGFLPRVWAREGISPMWVQVKTSDSWSRQRLAQALASLHAPGQKGLFDGVDSFYVPLMLEPFLGEQATVADLVSQIEGLVALLDAAIAPGETPAPDDIGPSDEAEESGL